uniref:Replicase protein n=1 Tax=Aphis craccivora nege-like virus 1 TaxID=2961853 RepID=A0A976RX50_9VIRU|nr:replicase protein [Aphis craccivora nege-like virus 1]
MIPSTVYFGCQLCATVSDMTFCDCDTREDFVKGGHDKYDFDQNFGSVENSADDNPASRQNLSGIHFPQQILSPDPVNTQNFKNVNYTNLPNNYADKLRTVYYSLSLVVTIPPLHTSNFYIINSDDGYTNFFYVVYLDLNITTIYNVQFFVREYAAANVGKSKPHLYLLPTHCTLEYPVINCVNSLLHEQQKIYLKNIYGYDIPVSFVDHHFSTHILDKIISVIAQKNMLTQYHSRPYTGRFTLKRQIMLQRLVGGSADDDDNNETSNYETQRDIMSSSVFVPMFARELGVDTQTVAREAFKNVVSNEVTNNLVVDSVINQLKNKITRNPNKNKVRVSVHLSPDEQLRLSDSFPCFDIQFSDFSMTEPHGFSHAHRLCEHQFLLNFIKHDPLLHADNKEMYAVDLGGNWAYYITRSITNVHCCCPILDARDMSRHVTRYDSLRHMQKTGTLLPHVYDKFVTTDTYFCTNKCQDCTVSAHYLIALHSTYDMTTAEIVESMYSHNSYIAYTSLIYHPAVIMEKRGTINALNCNFEKRVENGRTRIMFSFVDDPSVCYDHDYNTYIEKFTHTTSFDSNGNTYYVELLQNVNGIQFIKYVRLHSDHKYQTYHLPPSKFTFKLPLLDYADKVFIKTWCYSSKKMNYHNGQKLLGGCHLYPKIVIAQRSFYERIYQYIYMQSDANYNISTAVKGALIFNSRIVQAGTHVTIPDRVDCEEVIDIVMAAYIAVYKKKYNTGLTLKNITDDINEVREHNKKNALSRFVYKMFGLKFLRKTKEISPIETLNKSHVTTSDIISDMNTEYTTLKAYGWFYLDELFDVQAITTVDSIRIENIISDQLVSTSLDDLNTKLLSKGSIFNINENYIEQNREAIMKRLLKSEEVYLYDHHQEKLNGNTAELPTSADDDDIRMKIGDALSASVHDFDTPKCPAGSDMPANVRLHAGIVAQYENFSHYLDIDTHNKKCVSKDPHDSVLKIRGDGNCLFYAILVGSCIDQTVEQMKSNLLNSNYFSVCLSEQEKVVQKKILTDHTGATWGDDVTLSLCCCVYNIQVCLHRDDDTHIVFTPRNSTPHTITHILYRNDHFDVLVPSSKESTNPVTDGTIMKLSGDLEIISQDYSNLDLEKLECLLPKLTLSKKNNIVFFTSLHDLHKAHVFSSHYTGGPVLELANRCNNDIVPRFTNHPYHIVARADTNDVFDEHNVYILPAGLDDVTSDDIVEILAPLATNYSYVLYNTHEPVTTIEELKKMLFIAATLGQKTLTITFMTTPSILSFHGVYDILSRTFTFNYYRDRTFDETNDNVMVTLVANANLLIDSLLSDVDNLRSATIEDETTTLDKNELLYTISVSRLQRMMIVMNLMSAPKNKFDIYSLVDRNMIRRILARTNAYRGYSTHGDVFTCKPDPLRESASRVRKSPGKMVMENISKNIVNVINNKYSCTTAMKNFSSRKKFLKDYVSDVHGQLPSANFTDANTTKLTKLCDDITSELVTTNTLRPIATLSGKILASATTVTSTQKALLHVEVSKCRTTSHKLLTAVFGNKTAMEITHATGLFPKFCKQVDVTPAIDNAVHRQDLSIETSANDPANPDASSSQPLAGGNTITAHTVPLDAGVSETHADSLSEYTSAVDGVALGSPLLEVRNQDSADYEKTPVPLTSKNTFVDNVSVNNIIHTPPESEYHHRDTNSKVRRDRNRIKVGGNTLLGVRKSKSFDVTFVHTTKNIRRLRTYNELPVFTTYETLFICRENSEVLNSCNNITKITARDFLHYNFYFTTSQGTPTRNYGEKFTYDFYVVLELSISEQVPTDDFLAVLHKIKTLPGWIRVIRRVPVTSDMYRTNDACIGRTRKVIPTEIEDYAPKFLLGYGTASYRYNALSEIIEALKYSHLIQRQMHINTHKKLELNDTRYIRELANDSSNYLIYCTRKKKIVCSGPDSLTLKDYDYFFDFTTGNFVRNSETKRNTSRSPFLIYSDYTAGVVDSQLHESMKDLKHVDDVLQIPPLELVQGVPGAGKTTYIVNKFVQNMIAEKPTLVLTSTKNAKQDILERIRKLYKEKNKVLIKFDQFVRTLDSFVINCTMQVDTVYIDEALMQHPGKIIAVALKTKCKKMYLLGDTLQIPYINRIAGVNCLFSNMKEILSGDTEILNVSYRCPKDVASLLRVAYINETGKPMVTTSTVARSLSLKKIHTISEVPVIKDSVYLTFTQSDKHCIEQLFLKQKAEIVVKTVHEFQGDQHPDVRVVRLSKISSDTIFNNPPHVLVALTRHTRSLTYYTTITNDGLSKFIQTKITSQSLQQSTYKPDRLSSGFDVAFFNDMITSYNDCIADVTNLKFLDAESSDSKCNGSDCRVLRVGATLDSILRIKEQLTSKKGDLYLDATKVPNQHLGRVVNLARNRALAIRNHITYVIGTQFQNTVFRQNLVRRYVEPVMEINHIDDSPSMSYSLLDYHIPLRHVVPVPPKIQVETVKPNVETLQIYYELLMPGESFVDTELDSYMVMTSDMEHNLPDVTYSDLCLLNTTRKYDTLRPRLSTLAPRLRDVTQIEMLIALTKRNLVSPKLSGTIAVEQFAQGVANKFFEKMCRKDYDYEKEFLSNIVEPNKASLLQWIEKQDPSVRDKVISDTPIWDTPLNSYSLSIKRLPKPKLDGTANYEYAALQTILFHPKNVNAYFGPIMAELKNRVKLLLRTEFTIFSDKSPADFCDELNYKYHDVNDEDVIKLEVDMSKYDKSQNELHLLIELKIFERLGMSEFARKLWYNAHMYTKFRDPCTKISGNIWYQRKSGDCATFLGNTLILMATLCTCYEMDDVRMGLFSGDDSLLYFRKNTMQEFDQAFDIANVFNFESKLYFFKNSYFCSKFLLRTNGVFHFIPDVLKTLIKLGRTDIKNFEQCEEYRISVFDNIRDLGNAMIYDTYTEALCERYNVDYNFSFLFQILYSCASSPASFRELYYTNPTDTLEPHSSACALREY